MPFLASPELSSEEGVRPRRDKTNMLEEDCPSVLVHCSCGSLTLE